MIIQKIYWIIFSYLSIFCNLCDHFGISNLYFELCHTKMVSANYNNFKYCGLIKFATKKLHLFEFQVWASLAAFLAFSTNRKTSLQVNTVMPKRYEKVIFPYVWPLIWPFWPSLAFFNFFWSLNYNKSSNMQQWHRWPFYHLKELLLKISHFGSLWLREKRGKISF